MWLRILDYYNVLQAFRIAVATDPNHAESYTNLGVLEMRKGNVEVREDGFIRAGSVFYVAFIAGGTGSFCGSSAVGTSFIRACIQCGPVSVQAGRLSGG
jgi:hypothetical protein